MEQLVERFRTIPQPPLWVYPLLPALAAVFFLVTLPIGVDAPPDVLLEGAYLTLTILIAVPIRRLGIGVLELGWLVFLLGRSLDFLDELFVEPEPFVEPYLSGLIIVVSFGILVAGTITLLQERREQLDLLEARNEELELTHTAIEEAPIGITIADMTQDDEPLVAVNEGFTRLTGYDAEKTVGMNCRFLQGEDTSEEAVARMRATIENGESIQETIRNYRKDGTPFWNEITLAPLPQNGAVPHYVGFQQDVTDRVEFEHTLQDQRDNLHLLSQMVRHDIRNELQIIQTNADLLADHVSADGEQYREQIDERTDNAIELTTTARELGETMLQEESGQRSVSLTDSLGGQVEEIQSAYEHVIIDWTAPFPDISVEADERLDSVFRNLLKNAVQHNDCETPEITATVAENDDSVTVRIADNGPGIPDDLKAELFEQGQKGLKSEGTGIGTYLVQTLVSQYGGDVWVEDNDPQGCVFVLTLPKAE